MSAITVPEFNVQKLSSRPRVIVVSGIAALVTLTSIANAAQGSRQSDTEAVSARIAPVAAVTIAAPPAVGGAERTGEQLYKTTCVACHEAGVANAPKFGDKAAWAPRLVLGLDGLLKSAIAGKNAMPPRAGSDATDIELTRAIVYMANKAGANFKEPAAK
jgi:cytochrome c5